MLSCTDSCSQLRGSAALAIPSKPAKIKACRLDRLVSKVPRAFKSGQRVNYGYSGYGPQAMLAVLEDEARSTALARELAFATGDVQDCRCAIYTLIDPHVSRAVGSLRTMVWGPRCFLRGF